ncbi:Cystatin-1 [Halotydeus destructor]|nr:Cystatin-1 [Halotydeus destructor]
MKIFASVAILVLVGACSAAPHSGGLYDIEDTESESFIAILNLAGRHASNLVDSDHQSKVTQLLSAQQQVVGGVMYHLEFKLTETVCLKGEDKDLDQCEVASDAEPFVCDVKVWSRAWENFTEVASAVCHPKGSYSTRSPAH